MSSWGSFLISPKVCIEFLPKFLAVPFIPSSSLIHPTPMFANWNTAGGSRSCESPCHPFPLSHRDPRLHHIFLSGGEAGQANPSPSMQCRKCTKFYKVFFPLQVSQGLTALTFWVLVHFLFIFGAIVVYGVQLTLIRCTMSIISIFFSHRCQLVPTKSDQVCEGRVQPA